MKKNILIVALLSLSLFACENEDEIGNRIKYYNQQPKSEDVKGFWKLVEKADPLTTPPVFRDMDYDKNDCFVFDATYLKRLYLDKDSQYVFHKKDQRYWYSTPNRITYMNYQENKDMGSQHIVEFSMLYKLNKTKDTIFLRSDSTNYFYKVPAMAYKEVLTEVR